MNQWMNSPKFLTYLLLITGIWHILLASITPLTVDEAHYALYGLHPALSYFDHPPLVGWVQSVVLLVSDHELALRSVAIVFYALTAVLLHRFTLNYFGKLVTANLAVLLFALMPMSFLLGMAVVPETLLMPLAVALLWQAQRTMNNPRMSQWVILGGLIGLAGLSKYTAVLMAVGLLLVLVFSPVRRHILTVGFWTALLIAFMMMSPVLIWNAQHDWISILYQLNHGAPDDIWRWSNVLQSQVSQLLSYSPMIWLGAWIAMTVGIWRYRHITAFSLLLSVWLFSLPGLVVFTLASGKEPSLPHWLLFFYVLWLPWLASWLSDHLSWQQWVKWGSAAYAFLVLGILSVLIVYPQIGKMLTPNPAQDIFGWKSTAQQAHKLLEPNESLLTPNWVNASRLAWYARPTPIIVMDGRIDQFDLWFGSPIVGLSGVLILSPDDKDKLLTQFTQCQQLEKNEEGFRLYRCIEWQGK